MFRRRVLPAIAALAVFATVVAPDGGLARAQDVGQAEQEVKEAESRLEGAKRIVSEKVADRDRIEAELFAALQRYDAAVAALAAADADLDRVAERLAYAAAEIDAVESDLQVQAVSAYMTAVGAPGSLLFAARDTEDAMVVGPVLERAQAETLSRLDTLAVRRQELTRLQARFAEKREQVDALRRQVEAEADRLEELFVEADAEVAAAYEQARAAEAAYRASLDELAEARAREEQRRREEAERRRREAEQNNRRNVGNLRRGVEAWRPLVAANFPERLVEEALQVMQCESGGNPNAVNPYSGASGLFQFLPSTWAVASVRAGVGDRSVFDGEANIIAAAWLVSYYEGRGFDSWRAWSCKPWG